MKKGNNETNQHYHITSALLVRMRGRRRLQQRTRLVHLAGNDWNSSGCGDSVFSFKATLRRGEA